MGDNEREAAACKRRSKGLRETDGGKEGKEVTSGKGRERPATASDHKRRKRKERSSREEERGGALSCAMLPFAWSKHAWIGFLLLG